MNLGQFRKVGRIDNGASALKHVIEARVVSRLAATKTGSAASERRAGALAEANSPESKCDMTSVLTRCLTISQASSGCAVSWVIP